MRKTLLFIGVIGGLLLVGGTIGAVVGIVNRDHATAIRQAESKPIPVSLSTVLRNHGDYNPQKRPRFTQNATLIYYTEGSTGPQRLFERKLKFSTDGSRFRYDKSTLNRNQSFLSDGKILVRTTSQAGTQLEARVLDGFEAAGIKFQMATLGLLPILKRLSDPSTQVVYVGATARGSQFEVKNLNGTWYFYANANHLIDQLEVDGIHITFGDYRTVEGLKLPFHQQVKKGDKLLYELKFDAFDLNPVFAPDFFKSNLL